MDALAEEGGRLGRIVGVPISVTGDDEGGVPWVIPSSRRPKVDPIVEPIPDEVRAVLSHRLFIEKGRLSSALLNQAKRLAAFQNPEFYRRQKARLSTALTPRVIACAEDLPHHIALPRGCTEGLVELLRGLGADLRLEDSSECWQR
ncbi:MAG: hypothetical protein KIT14_12505 [bacterium]|nr:hypothetical protein [bacterium]